LLRPKPEGAGFSPVDVQERLDHADLSTTQQYLHAIAAEEHRSDDLPY
jgi:site-specific recombinase XerD